MQAPKSLLVLSVSAALLLAVVGLAWSQTRLLAPRYAHIAICLGEGRILVHGGLGPGDAFVTGAEIIDHAAGRVLAAPEPHECRAFHTATPLLDGTVLIAGGFVPPYSTSRTAELFDGEGFVLLDSEMSAPRELHAATLLADGCVLITGGFVGGVTSVAQCDIFDPASRTFRPTGEMCFGRFGHAACRLDGDRVLITGGTQYPGEQSLDSAELYDPGTGQFEPAGAMLADRSRHTATVLHDGRILITGGHSASAGCQLASTELFDPDSGTFAAGPGMAEPRMDHTATLLDDGRVLITGGLNGIGRPHTVASCEVFDPRSDTLASVASLRVAVHEHKAALLPSGIVLVCGGLQVETDIREAISEICLLTP